MKSLLFRLLTQNNLYIDNMGFFTFFFQLQSQLSFSNKPIDQIGSTDFHYRNSAWTIECNYFSINWYRLNQPNYFDKQLIHFFLITFLSISVLIVLFLGQLTSKCYRYKVPTDTHTNKLLPPSLNYVAYIGGSGMSPEF